MFKLVNHNTGTTHEFDTLDNANTAASDINKSGRARGFPDNFTVYDDASVVVGGTHNRAVEKIPA